MFISKLILRRGTGRHTVGRNSGRCRPHKQVLNGGGSINTFWNADADRATLHAHRYTTKSCALHARKVKEQYSPRLALGEGYRCGCRVFWALGSSNRQGRLRLLKVSPASC